MAFIAQMTMARIVVTLVAEYRLEFLVTIRNVTSNWVLYVQILFSDYRVNAQFCYRLLEFISIIEKGIVWKKRKLKMFNSKDKWQDTEEVSPLIQREGL